jgi:acyl-CoA reductase-like NAD-dependent aldehyde dehydrogenase
MAGNVVMVKHAGCVPQCAIAFGNLWLEAGAPAGAYTNLLISHDQVNRVIDDPRVKGVALTGGIEAATAKLEALRKEFSAWEAVSRGADFLKEKQGPKA